MSENRSPQGGGWFFFDSHCRYGDYNIRCCIYLLQRSYA